jgi:DNA polymerase III sliding clamp (beta) subunit (PCNA family)
VGCTGKAFTTDRVKAIHFIPNGVSVDVEVENPESGSYTREVEAEVIGKVPQRVGLNVTYVQDALRSIGGETITVHLGESPIDATLWTSDRGECRVVIMPVRV